MVGAWLGADQAFRVPSALFSKHLSGNIHVHGDCVNLRYVK